MIKRIVTLALSLALALPASAMTTPMLVANSPTSGFSTSAIRYLSFTGNGTGALSSAENVLHVVPIAGTISSMYARVGTAMSAGTYTFTVRKGASVGSALSDTTITCAVSSSSQTCNDTTHTVSVSAGEILDISITPASTPTAQTRLQLGIVFDGTTAGESMILSGSSAGSTGSATGYYVLGYEDTGPFSTETGARSVMPTGGTIDKLTASVISAPGVGKSRTYTLRKNGADTAITCQIAGAATSCTDSVNTVSVAAADLLSWKEVAAGTPTGSAVAMDVRFLPTTDGESVMFGSTFTALSAGANSFQNTGGLSNNYTTETDAYSLAPIAFTWKKLYTDFDTAPGAGTSRLFAARIAGATQGLTCTVSGTNKICNDTTNSASPVAGNIINWISTPTGTPAASTDIRISGVMFIQPASVTSTNVAPFNLNGIFNINGLVNIRN